MSAIAAESTPVIEIDGLAKTFRSRLRRREVQAVRDVSLRVDRGRVFAFVGPNGAGKTTTIYALLGLLRPDRGSVRLFDLPAGTLAARRRIGFQSEIFYTYGFKTATEVLRFYGRLAEMSEAAIDAAVPKQLERLGLAAASDRKVGGFSKGMVQRSGIAQALLHGPDLLILDEPTTGLDPEGRKLVADIILEEKSRGTTVFLSSHILSDVERTCDHVIILNRGSVALADSMENLRRDADEWEIEVVEWTPDAREAAAGLDVRDDPRGASIVRCRSTDKMALLRRLVSANATIGGVRNTGSLEDLYMRYAGGSSSG